MVGGVDLGWVFTSAGESGIVPTFCTLLPATWKEESEGENSHQGGLQYGKKKKKKIQSGDSWLRRRALTFSPGNHRLFPETKSPIKRTKTNQCGEWKWIQTCIVSLLLEIRGPGRHTVTPAHSLSCCWLGAPPSSLSPSHTNTHTHTHTHTHTTHHVALTSQSVPLHCNLQPARRTYIHTRTRGHTHSSSPVPSRLSPPSSDSRLDSQWQVQLDLLLSITVDWLSAELRPATRSSTVLCQTACQYQTRQGKARLCGVKGMDGTARDTRRMTWHGAHKQVWSTAASHSAFLYTQCVYDVIYQRAGGVLFCLCPSAAAGTRSFCNVNLSWEVWWLSQAVSW